MFNIASVTPTLCRLMDLSTPRNVSALPIQQVLDAGFNLLENEPVEKALIYAPDALGEWIYQKYQDEFNSVISLAPIHVRIQSIYPTYTPVCFASMFTGLSPQDHGIMKYEKPVLRCETLFDVLCQSKKKVAIVAVENSSIDLLFRNRPIDYYSEPYDTQVTSRVLKLIMKREYDFILAYHQEYDDTMHKTTPKSAKAIEAFRRHLDSFNTMSKIFNQNYSDNNRVVGFFPDHGTHIDTETGKGSHGSDSSEDMELRHFWGLYKEQA